MRFMKPVTLKIVIAYGIVLGMVAVLGIVPWTFVVAQAPAADKVEQKEASTPEKVGPAEALTATTFAQYQKQIKPQPGESRWLEVPWFLDFHAARQKAAAEGKALLVYSSGGATGIGAC